ncbi:MAG: MOSC domain-containing protein [Pseudomonadota bacterium]
MTGSNSVCASVAKLFVYPVKSMQGEARTSLALDQRGCVDDRLFAVRDANGKLGSGKTTRRFRRVEGLIDCQAFSRGRGVMVRFTDGTELDDDDPTMDERLSAAFGQDVALSREDEVSHFDAGAVHIVCQSEIEALASLMPDAQCVERRFRPNIVVSRAAEAPLADWVGKTIQLGRDVVLRVDANTERCRMVSMEQPELCSAPEILRTLVEQRDVAFGIYAEVLQGGSITLGEDVRFL